MSLLGSSTMTKTKIKGPWELEGVCMENSGKLFLMIYVGIMLLILVINLVCVYVLSLAKYIEPQMYCHVFLVSIVFIFHLILFIATREET